MSSHNGAPNGTFQENPRTQHEGQEHEDASPLQSPKDTAQKFEALAKERDALRAEVTEMRRSLEQIQEKHADEDSSLQMKLEETIQGKEHAETQYKTLLGKVNTIRSQLGERLRADAVSLWPYFIAECSSC